MTNVYVRKIVDEQEEGLKMARQECIERFGKTVELEVTQPTYNETAKSYMCPASWDQILCWPDTPGGVLATQPCPSYVAGFLPSNHASRLCTDNGVWFINRTENTFWSNYTACYKSPLTTIIVNFNKTNISTVIENYTPVVRFISETGYIVSLGTLIIAFAIMLFIKKLHCARNILHMHLFASFILRAFIFIVINLTFVENVGLSSDFNYLNGSLYFDTNAETNNWTCKLISSLAQYFTTANYSWILMEGLYLHNLIFRALFADSSNSIKWYVVLGWGLPLIIISLWITVRLLVEDNLCWTTHDIYEIFLIIAIPTTVSIMINLVLFMRISMVLYSKLRSPINEDSRRYQKWAKSTLVLVPLFGVHYALFLTLYYLRKTNRIVEIVWLILDRLFGSFQGFFVAILYCFLNGEVKAEIQPHIYYFLTFLATNKYSKYCFPCRKKFLRSVVGRSSVCTTMSCSSLYTNGVLHRNSKCRLDSLPKTRQTGDKTKDHICQNGTKVSHDISRRNSKSHRRCSHELHRHSQPFNFATAETTLCLEHNVCRSEPEINEETLKIMVQNNF
ncbi:parathyroid hormone/parathyroid hormone-related peptide receptor [Asbolus verrucosus]|uniref:Parathyroid hormone/parathyroid hormone-related peptide receptor n=1 Tax=Asbolus verrucosus TaxID=1661398 RepID=A0A482VCF1_ASBVE|nr:parathyroid hormone/parathyroid hormone-related peptide receptor [Asbolus verrucosus]